MSDPHERIAAAVSEWRQVAYYWKGCKARDLNLAACDHADKVLARHPHEPHEDCTGWAAVTPGNCPEVRDLADLWLGDGWDQP